jgi:inhibitor of KinA
MSRERIVMLGDSCVAMHLGTSIDPGINARCVALAAALDRLSLRGVRDIVPTYNSVTVHFDPSMIDGLSIGAQLEGLCAVTGVSDEELRTIEIPVTYGGAAGPDLSAVAGFADVSEAEVVRLHALTPYRVYMLGFLPGFAYMGSVDARIAMPRLDTPRLKVAAGSVGIAGAQTGIYPCDTPGGWRIIGRTETKIFDANRAEPFLLKAGNYVRFVAA